MKEDNINVNGIVTKQLKGAMYIVSVQAGENVQDIMCSISGKLRINKVKIVVGDRVNISISPYDTTRGYITWRDRQ